MRHARNSGPDWRSEYVADSAFRPSSTSGRGERSSSAALTAAIGARANAATTPSTLAASTTRSNAESSSSGGPTASVSAGTARSAARDDGGIDVGHSPSNTQARAGHERVAQHRVEGDAAGFEARDVDPHHEGPDDGRHGGTHVTARQSAGGCADPTAAETELLRSPMD